MNELKVKFIKIDGSTDIKIRNQLVNRFNKRYQYFNNNNDDDNNDNNNNIIDFTQKIRTQNNNSLYLENSQEIRVALLSLTCGGQGMNFTSANIVIFAEIYWTPGILLQAEDRVHRYGQTKDVSIHYLIAKKTIDDVIWPLISKKLNILGITLNGIKQHLNVDERIDLGSEIILNDVTNSSNKNEIMDYDPIQEDNIVENKDSNKKVIKENKIKFLDPYSFWTTKEKKNNIIDNTITLLSKTKTKSNIITKSSEMIIIEDSNDGCNNNNNNNNNNNKEILGKRKYIEYNENMESSKKPKIIEINNQKNNMVEDSFYDEDAFSLFKKSEIKSDDKEKPSNTTLISNNPFNIFKIQERKNLSLSLKKKT